MLARHASLGLFRFEPGPHPSGSTPELLFCDNETNAHRLFGSPSRSRWPKDAIHDAIVHGRREAVNPDRVGTKVAAHYRLELPAGGSVTLRLRLAAVEHGLASDFGGSVDALFDDRKAEADAFYAQKLRGRLCPGGAARRAAGVGGPALVQAVLPLQRSGLARWRPVRTAAAAGAEARPQRAVGAEPLQP